jgi:antitoxin component of MazEF toxin-antitoxin module
MPVTIKLRKIGNSLGLILPKEIAEHLHVGDSRC